MATEKDLSYILSTPGVPGGKNYITTLNVETGATVTFDVTAPFQKDAVLRSDVQIVNGERIYVTQFVPDKDGNLPSGAEGKYLSETVAKEADKQRADFYLREAPQTGQDLNIPGVKNTAPNPDAPGALLPGERPGDLTNSTIESKSQRSNYGPPEHLRYPKDLQNQDVITFKMRKYVAPSGLQTDKDGNIFTGIVKKRPQNGLDLGTVTLPIQPTIIDDNSVKWNDDSLNPLELATLSLSGGTIMAGMSGARDALKNMGDILTGADGQNIQKGLLVGAAGAALGRNLLSRVSGAILNPNIELLFEGPSLRVFNYRFQLSPRSDIETRNVMKIIRFFKQGMAVQRSPENLFLTTPNIFEVRYLFKEGDDHPYINRIKTCALTRCSVDYTPTGSYMTFPDGGMVSYSLNLTFEELEPIYSDDYDKIDGGNDKEITSIGF
jgi:hypothetical protein